MTSTLRIAGPPAMAVDLSVVPGYRWLPSGHSVFGPALIALADALDGLFLRWAAAWGAEDHRYPPLVSASVLERAGYLRCFPHLATFAVSVDADPAALRGLAAARTDATGAVALGATAPVRDVLSPAACHHVYAALEGSSLDGPRHVTTRSTCFRREEEYTPLRRQWSFTMREVVCIGTPSEVEAFLSGFQARIAAWCAAMGLPVAWVEATDPFFDPRSAGRLLQRLDGLKLEMTLPDGLALASLNRHRDALGEAFSIRRGDAWASSACVAFGLERWIWAVLDASGPDPRAWRAWMKRAVRHA